MVYLKSLKNYVFSALFAAIILIGTMFVQIPSVNGYVHIGDSLIYLAAAILPMPFSLISAGLGAAIADAVTPYIIYAPFTFVIKGCMAACFTSKGERILTKHNILAVAVADAINIVGYYITESIIFPQGSLAATLVTSAYTIPGNAVQSVSASVIFVIAALALDKVKFKSAIEKIR